MQEVVLLINILILKFNINPTIHKEKKFFRIYINKIDLIKIKPFIYSKDLLSLNIIDKNSFNTRKQYRSLMPNLVHSLDAASLGLLVNMYFTEKENINFFAVHDCFAVPCNKVSRIVDLLKLSYYKIYADETYLKKLDKNFKIFLLSQLGEDCISLDNEITILNINESNIKLKYPNINEILDLLLNNIEIFNNKYLINAKEPAQFISCLFEYKDYVENKISDIRTPILFDATCSGIQHLSALTTDLEISKLVNLIELNKDEASDFYEFCIKNIKLNIENLPEEDYILKNKILKLNLNRKMLKQSIMTVPYNVTMIGIADKISENFDKSFISMDEAHKLENDKIITLSTVLKTDSIKNKSGKPIQGIYIFKASNAIKKEMYLSEDIILTQRELNKLGQIIKSTVLSLIPPFANLKEYFDKIIDILKIINLPIYWETPSNMQVSANIMNMTQRKIRSKLIKGSKPITILIPTTDLNYSRIKTGLMPNFIHSLDASNIHLLIKLILLLNINNINLYTIHDCFATDYKNMAILEILIKKCFSDLYFNNNYLNIIHNSFINQINSITSVFEDTEGSFILVDPKLIKNKKLIKNSIFEDNLVKIYLPKLPEYKWSVNKNIIRKEIMFNQYFIS